MSIRNFIGLLILGLILWGCQNPSPSPSPSPAPTTAFLRVHLTPGLPRLDAALDECSRRDPAYEVSIVRVRESKPDPTADLSIRWGNQQKPMSGLEGDKQTYRLTELSFYVITHPSLPISSLPLTTVAEIFDGKLLNWSDVSADLESRNILPLMYPQDHPLRGMFEFAVKPQGKLTSTARIVPHQEAMLEVVSNQPGSIGLISDPDLSDSVQILAVSPSLDSLKQPVFAILSPESNPQTQNLLACVTQRLQE